MTPRIQPLAPADWPKEMSEALAALSPPNPRHPMPPRRDDRPKGLNILGTLANHPELTRAYHTFNGHVLFGSTLEPRTRELLILRVAVLRDAEYEWVQHKVIGADAGLSIAEISRVGEGPDAAGWSEIEAALLRAVDELVADAEISEPTWELLTTEFGEKELMDLVFTVGAYDLLAMAMRTFGVELDEDLLRWK